MKRIRKTKPRELSIYKLTQNQQVGFDKCSAMIVVSSSIEAAKQIHPSEETGLPRSWCWNHKPECWCKEPSRVEVEFLGFSKPMKEGTILLTSYGIDFDEG